jgi:hypothetical protein
MAVYRKIKQLPTGYPAFSDKPSEVGFKKKRSGAMGLWIFSNRQRFQD